MGRGPISENWAQSPNAKNYSTLFNAASGLDGPVVPSTADREEE